MTTNRRQSDSAPFIRVVVAEDSQTVQELLVTILESDPGIRVVGRARTGVEAVELTERLAPDLVTMDIHMPVMDGVEATKEIMVRAPTPIVIVASSASSSDVGRSFHAMRAGALTMIPKPDNPEAPTFAQHRDRLVATVKAMAQVKVVRRWST
ncbi:MAG: response regulator, partial [Gemmatimonadota bacterium]|nr:response regulator [Gemmatimonadota bacterium]